MKHTSPGGERLDRETLVGSIREQSALAADAAEALLDWADREPRLDIRYTRTRGFIETAGRPLLKLFPVRPPKIELQLHTLADHGESWDAERSERLVREFADIGVNLDPDERRWPKAPLEPLPDDARRERFLGLMKRVLDSLTAGP